MKNSRYVLIVVVAFAVTSFDLASVLGSSEKVEKRIYDFSERISLIVTDNDFQFVHCKIEKCRELTKKLPRLKGNARDVLAGRSNQWSGAINQWLADAHQNYDNSPKDKHADRITYGMSIEPESFEVDCSGPITVLLKKLEQTKETNKLAYRYSYTGPANKFCSSGLPENKIRGFENHIKEIESFAKEYPRVYAEAQDGSSNK